MSVGVCVALLLLLVLPATTGLWCYLGTTINHEIQCEGVGCVRILRKERYQSYISTRQDMPKLAMTCLPAETRLEGPEPEGCHTNVMTQEERCVCYDHDFCNSAPSRLQMIGVPVLLAFHVFQRHHLFL
uniref:Activin_recp domain-containing protein n=1 Tax=Panagrellus redivivus TaxID=6233 RepID=A0A7E4UP95_PANRE